MDANLEIARMRKEIVEAINQHQIPVGVTVLLLQSILREAQEQLDTALNNAVAKEKEEERKKEEQSAKCSSGNPKPSEETT